MAQPQRQAQFFVCPDGTIFPKAPPLRTTERKAIFERDGKICADCGRGLLWCKPFGYPWHVERGKRVAHVDHIIPRARGGQNAPGNLRLTCDRCNLSKGAT